MARCKIARVRTFYVAIIRGESCFEKNAFDDSENPHPPTKTRLPVKEYLWKYSRYRKKKLCYFEALPMAYFILWKTQF